MKYLGVLQDGIKTDRRGTRGIKRLNPYNPISYLVIVLVFVSGFIMFGVVGFWKEVDLSNPFKWR